MHITQYDKNQSQANLDQLDSSHNFELVASLSSMSLDWSSQELG